MASDNNNVLVGNDQPVSMQLLQDVYSEITGKTEKLIRHISNNHKATINDLEQLDLKIKQLYEQYNIVSESSTVTIYHMDDSIQRFSSFERFKIYDQSCLSPVVNVRLKFSFLVILPKTQRPQSYDLEIDILSRASLLQRSKNEKGFTKHMLMSAAAQTGTIELSYVDYTVAKNFMSTVEAWFEGLEQTSDSIFKNILCKANRYYPFLFRYGTALFLVFWFFLNYREWLTNTGTLEELYKLSLVSFGALFIASGVAATLGRVFSSVLEYSYPISYLRCNRGDDKLITKQKRKSLYTFFTGIGSVGLMIAVNIFSVYVAKYFGI